MKTNTLSFFTAMFLTFGITSLDFENYAYEENIRAYIAITIGVVFGITYVIFEKKEKQQS